jgi:GNAT superfamily N-acetyltransferase
MATYTLIKVRNRQHARAFLQLPRTLYSGDCCYIHPLNDDVENLFGYATNPLLQEGGEAVRFLLQCDDSGQLAGRIAAFVNPRNAYHNEQPTGGIGFFECINSGEAAALLFDACRQWLAVRGMEAMDGPINFGGRERWWGLQVDGFAPPSYGMTYNPPYYQALWEGYGFKNYFYQYSFLRPISMHGVADAICQKAERVARNPRYTFCHTKSRELSHFAADFCSIYNRAWVQHHGVEPMTREQAEDELQSIRPIIDHRLILFAYYDGEPIGFFIQIPDINEIVRRLGGGRLTALKKLRFWYLLRVKKVCRRIMGLAFGIVPEHRGHGVEGAMVMAFAKVALAKNFPYLDCDLTWVGDFNPAMLRFQQQLGGVPYKTHATYRLLFDRERQTNNFVRCRKMGRAKNGGEE